MIEIKRILLVEDSMRDAEMILTVLDAEHLANQVVHVRDGAIALDYLYRRAEYAELPKTNPALILLDLKMPRVDGLEVLRMVKADTALRLIPIVMMTSSAEEQDLLASYQLGANAYVVKPLKFGDFSAAVKQVALFWAVVNEEPPGSARSN